MVWASKYATTANVLLATLCLTEAVSLASATVFFRERFDEGWENRWVKSGAKEAEGSAGTWRWTAGKWYGDDKEDRGIQTADPSRFYLLSAAFPKFSNAGKDLVIQYSVKFEKTLDCGGAYIKLMPSDTDQTTFDGDSTYNIMFGPDVCGSAKKIHFIFNYKGRNYLWKKTPPPMTDNLTHVYTAVIHPDSTYAVYVDLVEKASGTIEEDWEILKPRKIRDPNASKPADWVEDEFIDDPADVKPEGWDDVPETIPDPKAVKPDDWDEEDDGEWEAPQVPNPEFKGVWKPARIKNPAYVGPWAHPMIDNPDFEEDPNIYSYPDHGQVGFELWQVKANTIFDNVLITDSFEEAKEFAEATWGASKAAEKLMHDEFENVKREAEQKERIKKEEERKRKLEEERRRIELETMESEDEDPAWEPLPDDGSETWGEDGLDAKDEL